MVALERSPFFEDMLLTVGDWSFCIWREGETTPLFQSGYAGEYYACGTCTCPGQDMRESTARAVRIYRGVGECAGE